MNNYKEHICYVMGCENKKLGKDIWDFYCQLHSIENTELDLYLFPYNLLY